MKKPYNFMTIKFYRYNKILLKYNQNYENTAIIYCVRGEHEYSVIIISGKWLSVEMTFFPLLTFQH